MFFKILRLQVKKEIEELKALHRIELAEKEAALSRREIELKSGHEVKVREVVSLLKLESEQKIKQLELNNQRALDAVKNEAAEAQTRMKEGLLADHYAKLTTAMSKLHEEGNITTRFTQELALKMFESQPVHKTQTKVITGQTKAP